MIVEVRQVNGYEAAMEAARITVRKPPLGKEPSDHWKQQILMAEHSPLRAVVYLVHFQIPKWVSTHFVRHKIGVEHFVSTSREDRVGGSREENEKCVDHIMILNAQAIIAISRKRLCFLASPETGVEWRLFLQQLQKIDPELYNTCENECVYRGFCPEIKSCNWYKTPEAQEERREYLKNYRDRIIKE